MRVMFKSDFLKTHITHDKSTHGKWQINFFSNRIRFNFENWPTGAFILFNLENYSRSYVQKWCVLSERASLCLQPTMNNDTGQTKQCPLLKPFYW